MLQTTTTIVAQLPNVENSFRERRTARTPPGYGIYIRIFSGESTGVHMETVEVWKFKLYLQHQFNVILLTNDCLIEKCQKKKLVIERGQIHKQGIFKERLKTFFFCCSFGHLIKIFDHRQSCMSAVIQRPKVKSSHLTGCIIKFIYDAGNF